MEKLVENLVNFNNIKRDLEIKIAKIGKKGMIINNAAVRKINKLANYSNNNNYIKDEVWNTMSVGERTITRFKFSCYNQNPHHSLWKKFSEKEQETFLEKRLQFWKDEISNFSNNPDDVDNTLLYKMDKFFYYMNRDKEGYIIPIKKELKEKHDLREGEKAIISECVEYVSLCSQKRMIFNDMKYNGKWFRTQGKSCTDKAIAINHYNTVVSKQKKMNNRPYDINYKEREFNNTYGITDSRLYYPRPYHYGPHFGKPSFAKGPFDNANNQWLGRKRAPQKKTYNVYKKEEEVNDNQMNLEEEEKDF